MTVDESSGDGAGPEGWPAPVVASPDTPAPAGAPAEAAIRIDHLTKRYGDLYAVRDLSLEIPRGSVFGLIGPNGAGKTTTFSVLATLLRPRPVR